MNKWRKDVKIAQKKKKSQMLKRKKKENSAFQHCESQLKQKVLKKHTRKSKH
jgi:hypothetical protein